GRCHAGLHRECELALDRFAEAVDLRLAAFVDHTAFGFEFDPAVAGDDVAAHRDQVPALVQLAHDLAGFCAQVGAFCVAHTGGSMGGSSSVLRLWWGNSASGRSPTRKQGSPSPPRVMCCTAMTPRVSTASIAHTVPETATRQPNS